MRRSLIAAATITTCPASRPSSSCSVGRVGFRVRCVGAAVPNNREERRDVVWNTYRECDARCWASHLSLIQPSVLACTPPGTRILGMTTTAITTMTTPTISSIWSRPRRHQGHRTDYIDWTRSALFSIAQRTRLARRCLSAVSAVPTGHGCVVCVCALGNSAVHRRSVHLQHATRIRRSHRCNGRGLGGVYRGGLTLTETTSETIQEDSNDESDCGHPRRGTGNAVARLAGARCRT